MSPIPSLLDFYQAPTGTPAPFIQQATAEQSARLGTEAGIDTSRMLRNFGERSLPQLASGEAAAGRFYSSGAQTRAAQHTQDVGDATGDVQRKLAYNLADLTRGGVMAQLGVSV